MAISIIRDASFLAELDKQKLKTTYVKILVLDRNELPLRAIEGRVSGGSISVDGSSSVRRSGSITFVAEETENNLEDVDNLLSMNKRIKILIGVENTINSKYDKIIWFNQGVFVITQPSINHTTTGVNISLQLKDKMSLLNGDCGGHLPASVTFSSYDQIIGYYEIPYKNQIKSYLPLNPNNYTVYGFKNLDDGNVTYMKWSRENSWEETTKETIGMVVSCPQRIFDIIQTAVCNYGGEAISKIIINDVNLDIKNIVRYVGSDSLYYNRDTDVYSLNADSAASSAGVWKAFNYNEDCGHIYTDFIYPGELVTSLNETVTSVLDKIISVLGNYEYYYDIDGNFVFQEKKNYLNTSYLPINKLDKDGFILNQENYWVDFSNSSKSIYTFEEGSTLIGSYANTPSYTNIKNDFHIWGKNQDGYAIHYHVAIKEKPMPPFNSWYVQDELDDKGNYTGRIKLVTDNTPDGYMYEPADWRAELYLRGLEKASLQQRPDIYEQELIDLFDSIYNMKEKTFKTDLVNRPNELKYWFDYIEPIGSLHDISVDTVGIKTHSYQQDKIIKLYDTDVPNVILINLGDSINSRVELINKCESEGQPYSNVSANIYKTIALGTVGYTAKEVARDLLYQKTSFNAGINISSIPIYYLEPNRRITVTDKASNIYGDYIIKSFNIPLDGKSTMSISATRALERV